MWLRATIEELSSIFVVFWTRWKHAYFTSFLVKWWALWHSASCNLKAAAAPYYRKQVGFMASWTEINLILKEQHLPVMKDAPWLKSSTFTFLWPFPFLRLYLTNTVQQGSRLFETTQGCFRSFCAAVWMERQSFIHTSRAKWTVGTAYMKLQDTFQLSWTIVKMWFLFLHNVNFFCNNVFLKCPKKKIHLVSKTEQK